MGQIPPDCLKGAGSDERRGGVYRVMGGNEASTPTNIIRWFPLHWEVILEVHDGCCRRGRYYATGVSLREKEYGVQKRTSVKKKYKTKN